MDVLRRATIRRPTGFVAVRSGDAQVLGGTKKPVKVRAPPGWLVVVQVTSGNGAVAGWLATSRPTNVSGCPSHVAVKVSPALP